jgi:hypothetical protein
LLGALALILGCKSDGRGAPCAMTVDCLKGLVCDRNRNVCVLPSEATTPRDAAVNEPPPPPPPDARPLTPDAPAASPDAAPDAAPDSDQGEDGPADAAPGDGVLDGRNDGRDGPRDAPRDVRG